MRGIEKAIMCGAIRAYLLHYGQNVVKMWSKRGRNCGQKVSPIVTSVSLKMKKSLKTNGFQGLTMVEISGI